MTYERLYRADAWAFGREPDTLLVAHWAQIRCGAPVLDVGAGQGRNGLFLARNGLAVEALEPTEAGRERILAVAARERLELKVFPDRFQDWTADRIYSAVLLFGLVPDLDRDDIRNLARRTTAWLEPSGLAFVTAFTTDDPASRRDRESTPELERNSFSGSDGGIRTYLEPGELKRVFADLAPVSYAESLGPLHTHGGGEPERHVIARALFRKGDPCRTVLDGPD